MSQQVWAIIPARAGSKRVPMKNFKEFSGQSLLQRTIEEILNVKAITDIVVSTDRVDLVQAYARRVDRLYVHSRSASASNDEASAQAVIEEVLREYNADVFIYLQPTSPLRDREDIGQALKLYETGLYDSVVSVSEVSKSLYYCLQEEPELRAHFLFPQELTTRSQELKPLFALNGAIYISSAKHILSAKSFFKGKVGVYKMSAEKSIDIDTLDDWNKAESLVRSKTT